MCKQPCHNVNRRSLSAPHLAHRESTRGPNGSASAGAHPRPPAPGVWTRKQKVLALWPDQHGFKSISTCTRAKWVEILSLQDSQRNHTGPDTWEPTLAQGHPNGVLQSQTACCRARIQNWVQPILGSLLFLFLIPGCLF